MTQKKPPTLSEIMFHMKDGNKTFLVRDMLFEGKVELANQLYVSCLRQRHDVSLKQIVYNNHFFEQNVLTLDSKLPLINDLKDYVLSKQERRRLLFACVGQPQAGKSLSWMLEHLNTHLSLNDKDELASELVHHHFIRVCGEEKINGEQSLLLIKHLPPLFWEQSLKENSKGLSRWLEEQQENVHHMLVKCLLHENMDKDNPLFEIPCLSRQLLKEETQDHAALAPSKTQKM